MMVYVCAAESESEAVMAKDFVVSDLERSEFVLNVSKSHLEPVQVVEWLGFTVNLKEGCFSVPDDKIDRLKLATVYSKYNLDRLCYCSFSGGHSRSDNIHEFGYWACVSTSYKGNVCPYQPLRILV